ncbi:Aldehyde/histidinol dehydrogenase [Penicillium canescens]|nr:Aldehyde/histidinol dehydrogenase [Penicillium canescens]KAJ6162130.1 Aldehyde/histidinol dehydrogenase [Penicillium canescens]
MDQDQEAQSAQFDECLLSLDDLFPPVLENSPMGILGSWMEPPVSNSAFTDTIDVQAFFSSAQNLVNGQSTNFAGQSPVSIRLEPESASRSKDSHTSSDTASSESAMAIDDDDCAKACAKLATYPKHILDSVRVPSKYTMRRFVRVFFRHVARHVPIVHEPTFSLAAASSPLLLAIMASGAAFLSERTVANSMCSAAVQLIFQHDCQTAAGEVDCTTKLATLQVHLLLSYIGIHCGMEQWPAYAYPLAVNCANGALRELKAYPVTTYKEWVLQESINRCLAVTVLIGAAPDSLGKEKCFVTPISNTRFALPSRTADWLVDEPNWNPPGGTDSLEDAARSVLSGRKPNLPVSEFGLVTIVALILYRVCSFETMTTSFNEELFPEFVGKMEKAVQALDDMLRDRLSNVRSGLPPDPTLQCAKSLLNSIFYHLYGSLPLASMKKLFSPSAPPMMLGDITHLFDRVSSSHLYYKGVGRAADQLRIDCQLGLDYLQRMTHEFGPECAMSTFEGNLLLYWYLEFVRPLLPQLELRDTVRKLINEGFSEVHDLELQLQDQIAIIPLVITSRLLSDQEHLTAIVGGAEWGWGQRIRMLPELLQSNVGIDTDGSKIVTSNLAVLRWYFSRYVKHEALRLGWFLS